MALPRTDYVSPPWWPDYPPHRKQQIALWGYERTPDLVYGGAGWLAVARPTTSSWPRRSSAKSRTTPPS